MNISFQEGPVGPRSPSAPPLLCEHGIQTRTASRWQGQRDAAGLIKSQTNLNEVWRSPNAATAVAPGQGLIFLFWKIPEADFAGISFIFYKNVFIIAKTIVFFI